MATIEELIAQYSEREEEARAANIRRQEQVTSIFDEIIARYGPGGTYGAAAEALLGQEKVRDVGATTQRDITRGLYGIRPYEQEWEATVGAPARLRLEDIKMERLSQAQLGKAGFLERIEEPYPDYGALMQAVSAQAGAGGAGGAGGISARGGGGGVTPVRQFDWEGDFSRSVSEADGWGYGERTDEPITGGVYGVGGETLVSPSAPAGADTDYWLSQGYTGFGPAFEEEAKPDAGDTIIDTAAWRAWESKQKAMDEATPWGYKGQKYPSAEAWKKAGQRGVL